MDSVSSPQSRPLGQVYMTLTELIHYFRSGGKYERFCQEQSLDPESEVVEIYASVPLSIESNLAFFEIEKTGGSIEHSHDNIKYRNLFDFYYFQGAIEESRDLPNQHLDDSEIANKLLSYAINDA